MLKGLKPLVPGWKKWLRGYLMADSTRDMRRSVYTKELETKFGNQKLTEITHEDLRALTDAIVELGAPASVQVYRWATERGQKVENPRPASIARFEPRDRTLTPEEIRIMYQYMGRIGTSPSIRAAVKLLLLTMVRKSELTNASWSEVNFSEALWTIPKERMKRRNPHLVFLSRQALDILIALKTFSGGSDYVLPSRYNSDVPMSSASLNRVMTMTYKLAQKEGKALAKLGPHDLSRTSSTLLHDWADIIAKAASSYSITSPMDNLSIFLTTLAILACMAIVAANVLLVLVTAWIIAYAGIFVLGFGGSRCCRQLFPECGRYSTQNHDNDTAGWDRCFYYRWLSLRLFRRCANGRIVGHFR